MPEVRVGLGERSYKVVVGHGARHSVGERLPVSARRVAVITQNTVPPVLVPDVPGRELLVLSLEGGEEIKTLATVASLCSSLARAGFTRDDAVVGVGGGLVTDLAGFVAATYHRGIAVAHVATTLLGMIDASVGGKTAVNLPEGKNLVGAFWQPTHVACDLDALASLPRREMRSGLGEMAKYDFIACRHIAGLEIGERIAACVQIKAEIVADDEREAGRRAILNYGHTLGHALETASGFSVAHGEAVAIGLLFAAELAFTIGRIDAGRVDDHYRVVIEQYGLDVAVPAGTSLGMLVDLMARDKKSKGSLTFVLDGPDGLELVPDVPRAALDEAWTRLLQRVGAPRG